MQDRPTRRDLNDRPPADANFPRSVLLGCLAIIALTLIAYVPAIRSGYIWDDDFYLTNNRVIRTPDGLLRTWVEPTANPQYYPLVFTSFWIEYRLWGLHPAGYHAVNILLHAAGACLLWSILRRLNVPGAWLGALLFAVHPVQVESVAWVTERKNVLSGVLFFAALLSYLRFALPDSPLQRRWGCYALALLLFLAALFSKSVTCSLPAVILILLWWKRDRLRLADIVPLLPMFAIGFAMAAVTVWVEHHHVRTKDLQLGLLPLERILLAGRAVWFYFGKILLPFGLTFSYEKWTISSQKPMQFFAPLGLLLVIITLWLARRRIGKAPLAALLLYVIMLVPALGFIDVYPFRYSWVADHFQYLAAAVPIAALVGLAWRYLSSNQPLGRILAAAVVLLFCVLTLQQARAYRDERTLWADTLEKNPESWMAHNNLGKLLLDAGNLDEAQPHFEEAHRLNPQFALALSNWATIEMKRRNFPRAIQICERAVRTTDPNVAEAYVNLGQASVQIGEFTKAFESYRSAIERAPDYVLARMSLADLLLAFNKMDEAEQQLREVIRIDPEDAEPRALLGKLYAARGNNAAAIEQYLAASRLRPGEPVILKSIASLYALLGRRSDAIEYAQRAVQFNPEDVEAAQMLAALRDPATTLPAAP